MKVDPQPLLFGGDAPAPLDIEDGSLELIDDFLDRVEGERLFQTLRRDIDWRQEQIHMYGRAIDVPRLTAWYGDEGRAYMYSGISMDPLPWTRTLADLRRRVEARSGASFNAVLLNLYRDGRDSVAWHSDDEPELGPSPTIASVSLGTRRTFQLRHKRRRDLPRVDLDLDPNSLLVMRPPTQAHWLHGIPKRKRLPGERINLTFRRIDSRPG